MSDSGAFNEFKNLTGYGILINTSFNVRGEPLVCNPEDALRCFMNTGIDYLVMNDFLIDKADMAPLAEEFKKGYEFALDYGTAGVPRQCRQYC